MRATFSGAYVVGKNGIISVDYELVTYGNAKLKNGGDGDNFYDQNAEISEAYKTSGNLRIGGERMVTKNISLRGGFEYLQSPYNKNAFGTKQLNGNANTLVYAGGIGYRTGSFFADLAYRYSTLENYDFPYPTPVSTAYAEPEAASFKTVKNDVIFTLGFRF